MYNNDVHFNYWRDIAQLTSSDPILMIVCLGAVPVPESLLLSPPPDPFSPVSADDLLQRASPAQVEELLKTCKGHTQCVYDTLATGNGNLGLEALKAKDQYQNMAQLFGKDQGNSFT